MVPCNPFLDYEMFPNAQPSKDLPAQWPQLFVLHYGMDSDGWYRQGFEGHLSQDNTCVLIKDVVQ